MLLALGSHLKGALEAFAVALCCWALAKPECLGTLVDCLAFNYHSTMGWTGARPLPRALPSLLSKPMTMLCGHSYCRHCLGRELRVHYHLCHESH
ncbi:LON peptidase and RING finger protein 1 [Heterocephalus glaber]|uniref:LON peptidase and RING finger protein 1 n=1 Tax=Heterocephalus glaber TaxID=10181 RepID=G5AUA9_HETGA|nr:LON peptidase and RING finger protein 1 [Heterocephalus glaber]